MNDAGQIRVACLGAGYFSQFHYGAWARIEGVRVVGAADLNIEAARATGAPAFSTLEEMLTATVPDVLDVILPPVAHAEAVRTALAAGVRTIISQKPFCVDLAEAQAVTAEAEAVGAQIIIHENFRFMPWYRVIRDQICQGRIGTPLQATFRLRPGDGQGPDAYLDRQPYFREMPHLMVHETGVHWIDTFRFMFGDPVAVYADLRKVNPVIAGEDAGHVILDHPDGVRTLLDGNRLADHSADNMRRTMGEGLFEGTEGTLTLLGDGSVRHRSFGTETEEIVSPADPWDGFGGDCVRHLQQHVVDALRAGTVPENTAQDYMIVLRTRDAVYESAETGRKVAL